MLYFILLGEPKTTLTPDNATAAIACEKYDDGKKLAPARSWFRVINRNDLPTFEAAQRLALLLGEGYIATDAGEWVSPRYDVIETPTLYSDVSYAFNGDYYPCGVITHINDSKRRIVATDSNGVERVFWRQRLSGCWKYQKTWSMIAGHVSKQNPEF